MNSLAIPMSSAMGKITLNIRIKGVRIANLRIKAAILLFRFAAFIAGTQINIDLGSEFDELPIPGGKSMRRSYMLVGGMEIPCQASCREDSPLYVSNVYDWASKVDFFLDGVKRDEVISYDVDGGWMRVLKHDSSGSPYVAGDEVANEVLRGKVEIRAKA